MKQNKSSRSTVLLFLLGAALIVAALIMLVPDLLNYKQSNDTYEALKENYISEKPENTEVAEETGGDDSWWYTDVDVNLEELQQVNADIIGWIRFDNLEQLSYPVLYSGDDEKYLRTDIYGNQTIAGCIFMEGMNTPDFQDYHTILYGHNMKNGSIFGTLDSYKKADYWKEHPIVRFYVDGEPRTYEVFAAVETQVLYEDEDGFRYYRYDGDIPEEEYDELVTWLRGHSDYDTEIVPEYEDQILMLSTCSYHTKNGRFVVAARRVAEP